MLEIIFVTIMLIGALWASVCIIDHAHKLRMREIQRFMNMYRELHIESERQRSAREMAATIMVVEHFRNRKD